MIFICLTMVDLPLSPDPIQSVSSRIQCMSVTRDVGDIPSSRILHSRRNFLESSSNVRSMALLFFFWSPSPSLLGELMQLPIVGARDTAQAELAGSAVMGRQKARCWADQRFCCSKLSLSPLMCRSVLAALAVLLRRDAVSGGTIAVL